VPILMVGSLWGKFAIALWSFGLAGYQ
jgi:hypothetical protein